MRAQEYGTATEQAMWRIGYQTPSQIRGQDLNRCYQCGDGETTERGTFRCGRIKAAVARNATCAMWRSDCEVSV